MGGCLGSEVEPSADFRKRKVRTVGNLDFARLTHGNRGSVGDTRVDDWFRHGYLPCRCESPGELDCTCSTSDKNKATAIEPRLIIVIERWCNTRAGKSGNGCAYIHTRILSCVFVTNTFYAFVLFTPNSMVVFVELFSSNRRRTPAYSEVCVDFYTYPFARIFSVYGSWRYWWNRRSR